MRLSRIFFAESGDLTLFAYASGCVALAGAYFGFAAFLACAFDKILGSGEMFAVVWPYVAGGAFLAAYAGMLNILCERHR